jgi:hypothetical protein
MDFVVTCVDTHGFVPWVTICAYDSNVILRWMRQQLIQPNPQFGQIGQQSILPPNLNPQSDQMGQQQSNLTNPQFQFGQMGQQLIQQPHLNPQFGQSIQSAFHGQQQNQQPSSQDLYAFFHQQQQQPSPQDLYAFFFSSSTNHRHEISMLLFSSSNHHHHHNNNNHHHKISIHFGNFIKI